MKHYELKPYKEQAFGLQVKYQNMKYKKNELGIMDVQYSTVQLT